MCEKVIYDWYFFVWYGCAQSIHRRVLLEESRQTKTSKVYLRKKCQMLLINKNMQVLSQQVSNLTISVSEYKLGFLFKTWGRIHRSSEFSIFKGIKDVQKAFKHSYRSTTTLTDKTFYIHSYFFFIKEKTVFYRKKTGNRGMLRILKFRLLGRKLNIKLVRQPPNHQDLLIYQKRKGSQRNKCTHKKKLQTKVDTVVWLYFQLC